MSHFWEFVTLLGFLLMSGELFIEDKGELNERWSSIMLKFENWSTNRWLNRVGVSSLRGTDWQRFARRGTHEAVFVASWFIWMPICFLSFVLDRMADEDNVHIDAVILTMALMGPVLCVPVILGLSLLIFHFSQRAMNSGNDTYFGLQLGAYLTIASQVRKVFFPN
jgi:hypothetical protein